MIEDTINELQCELYREFIRRGMNEENAFDAAYSMLSGIRGMLTDTIATGMVDNHRRMSADIAAYA